MSDDTVKPSTIGDDLIWGAQAIADELGVSVQRIYYLIRTQKIPITKIGNKTIIASRKQLRRSLSLAS
jgi:hypothetical protein